MIIDQLPELTNTFDTDEIPIERGTNTYKTKISTFFSGLRDLIAARVAKSGDTMTGVLTLIGTSTTGIKLKSIEKENGVIPSGEQIQPRIEFHDKNDFNLGYLYHAITTDGRQGFSIVSRRTVNSSTVTNYLALYTDASGNNSIVLLPVPWRKALNLGTDGALPITIAQGGSGQTAVASYGSKSAVIASETTGYTVQVVTLKVWGKVAQIAVGVKASSTGTVTGKGICTLKPLALPGETTAVIPGNSNFTDATISTTGILAVTGNFASTSTTYYFRATYLLA